VRLWDCLVTTEDGTIVDCESMSSGRHSTSAYETGGYITFHLPSHGVVLQLPRGSAGAFRFRCSLNSSVLQSTTQGHWSTIQSERLEGFEYPAAVAVLEQEASKRTRSLASSVPWKSEGGLEKLRAGKWSVERVWPGSNVCILNLDTGDLQIWLTPRGFYLFGAEAEGRAATGLLSGSCFEVVAPDAPARDNDDDQREGRDDETAGSARLVCSVEPGSDTGGPRERVALEAREELQSWVLQGAAAFQGEVHDVPPKGAQRARPRKPGAAFANLRGGGAGPSADTAGSRCRMKHVSLARTRSEDSSPARQYLAVQWGGRDFAVSNVSLAWRRLGRVARLRGGLGEAADEAKGGARDAMDAVESELLRRKEAMQRDERLKREGEEEVVSKR